MHAASSVVSTVAVSFLVMFIVYVCPSEHISCVDRHDQHGKKRDRAVNEGERLDEEAIAPHNEASNL